MAEPEVIDDGLGTVTLAGGPWSAADAPEGALFSAFGPLRVPLRTGMKARLEVDRASGRIGAVSVRVLDCEVQLQVVASPRGQHVWTDARRQLMARLRSGAGHLHAVEGRFGPEVAASVTTRNRDGLLSDAPVRYVGIDGDRWLLRATVVGRSALSDQTIERVDAFLSQCAVERGDEPFPAGAVMPLAPPEGELLPRRSEQ